MYKYIIKDIRFFQVVLNICISLIRCIVSMTVNASVTAGDYADKVYLGY